MNHVVLASDNNYRQNLLTVLLALNATVKDLDNLRVTVITDGSSRFLAQSIAKHCSFNIDFYELYLPDIEFPCSFYGSKFVFSRLWIEQIKNIENRVIYLDCDVLPRTDITKLINVDMSEHTFAASQDAVISSLSHPFGPFYHVPQSGRPDGMYFNSGVMVIDVEKWISANVISRSLELIGTHGTRIRFVDQEVLNMIFEGNFKELDISWNYQTLFRWNPLGIQLNNRISKENIQLAGASPKIVHFNSTMLRNNSMTKPYLFPQYDYMAGEWLTLFQQAGLLLAGDD